MSTLFTIATLIAGGIAILFGIVKGIRDLRSGGLVFTEIRMLAGGLLTVGSTLIASLTAPILLELEQAAPLVDALQSQPFDPRDAIWWAVGLIVCALAFFITPTPRQMAEEYAMERHGLAGLVFNQNYR